VNKRLEELGRRKQSLIARCTQEREEVAGYFERCRPHLDLTKTLASIGNTLKSHPLLVAGASGFLMSGRARGFSRLALEVVGVWRAIGPLWSWWRKRRGGKQEVSSALPAAKTARK